MKITLSYQPQQLIPPHSYAAVMSIDTSLNEHNVEFSLEYLGRDGVSDDELVAEGFTRNDDFSWSGELSAWNNDIESFKRISYQSEPNNNTYIHANVDGNDMGFPVDIENAEMVFQELMQAILEMMQIEAPLYVECCIEDQKQQLTWNFAKRSIQLNQKNHSNWEAGRDLLKIIYSIDYESIKPTKKSTKNGVSFGDGYWFPIGNKSVLKLLKTYFSEKFR